MKKIFWFLCLLNVLFLGCRISLAENDTSIEYGSLVGSENQKSLNVSSIYKAKITVTGDGINHYISATCDSINNGVGSFVIPYIPVGNNRLVTVTGYDQNGNIIEDAIIRKKINIKTGVNVLGQVDWETTCIANAYNYFLQKGIKISKLSNYDISTIESLIPTKEDCEGNLNRINYEALYADYFLLKDYTTKTKLDYLLPASPILKRLYVKESIDSTIEEPCFIAEALYSDNTKEDVTLLCDWELTDSSIVNVIEGKVSLLAKGKTTLKAKYTKDEITRYSPQITLTVNQESAKNKIYLDISDKSESAVNYAKHGASVAAWIWGGKEDSHWYAFDTEDYENKDYLSLTIPHDAEGLLIARGRELNDEYYWDGLSPLWNKTQDIYITNLSDKNTIKINDWGSSSYGASVSLSYKDHGDYSSGFMHCNTEILPSEDDTSLKSILINNINVNVSNRVVYTVPYDREKVSIKAEPNSEKATVQIVPDTEVPLAVGASVDFKITVIAVDKNVEEYTVKVKRSTEVPINSTENIERCYIEDTEEQTITFVYDLSYWGESSKEEEITVRGSFTKLYNEQTRRWGENKEKFTLTYDSNYNWYSLVLPINQVNIPGFSGQPNFRFYKNGKPIVLKSTIPEKYIFNGEQIILFSTDNQERRIKELADNKSINDKIKDEQDFTGTFDLNTEEGKQAVSNFRNIPCANNMYRSYHPFYPTHENSNLEQKRMELVQKFMQDKQIKADINLCNDRSLSELMPYTVNGVGYNVEIPEYYKQLIESNNVLYVGDKNIGNGIVPSANFVYYLSDSEVIIEWVKEIINFVNTREGPYLIHCEIGVDRTGFFSAIFASLCGASWQEIKEDYSKSSRMGIGEFRDYRILKYSLEKMLNVNNLDNVNDLQQLMFHYLVSSSIITETELNEFISRIK